MYSPPPPPSLLSSGQAATSTSTSTAAAATAAAATNGGGLGSSGVASNGHASLGYHTHNHNSHSNHHTHGMDTLGTIDPAALSAAGVLSSHEAMRQPGLSKGQKRSRSPGPTGEGVGEYEDEATKAKKRGRPSDVALGDNQYAQLPSTASIDPLHHAPHGLNASAGSNAHGSPAHTSPAKPATKTAVKALPTMRDHTTDELNPEGDEYVIKEIDEDGDRKVSPTGHLADGRQYRMKTFCVPNRGNKLFMLATECARVLNYRDSYLLFNKNRSLHKIIANQIEKDELIHQEILPYSYRSRQIAIVSARSMFRQFGARVIVNGRRVRDDYWETKARKQGFTEQDLAGDKRPGVAKSRDALPMEPITHHAQQQQQTHPTGLLTHNVEYRDLPIPSDLAGASPIPNPHTPIPMIQADPRGYGAIPSQRQDLSGAPYTNRTQSSPIPDLMHQATNAADLNKTITAQRNIRQQTYKDAWNRQVEPHLPGGQQSPNLHPSPQMPGSHLALPHGYPQHAQPPQQHAQGGMMSSPRYQAGGGAHLPRTDSPGARMQQQQRQVYPHQQQQQQQQQHAQQGGYGGYQAHQGQQGHLWGHPPPPPQTHHHSGGHAGVGGHHSPMAAGHGLPGGYPQQQQQQQHHAPPLHHQQQQHQQQPGGMYAGGVGGGYQPRSMYPPGAQVGGQAQTGGVAGWHQGQAQGGQGWHGY